MNLYVSNLAYGLTDDELRSQFAAFGTVSSARVVLDRETGRSRGFGFVDMPNDAEAQAALNALEGATVGGRALRVVVARPKEERPAAPRNFASAGGGPRPNAGGSGGDRGSDRGGSGGGKRDWSRDRGDRGGGGKRDWDGGGRGGDVADF